MKLITRGHDRYAAVEQALLNFFPDKPEGEAVSSLSRGKKWITATTKISTGGKTSFASARTPSEGAELDYCLKQSFYKAAKALLKKPAPWGSLTGIRPAKLTARIMESGLSPERVLDRKYHVAPERRELAVECAQAAIEMKKTLSPRDFSLYVAIPFCPTRCTYCSFVSNSVEKSTALIEPYVARLVEEIGLAGEMARSLGLRPVSLYWGGGTPTTLSAGQILEVGRALEAAFDLSALREYTVEAGRPDTITPEKLAALRSLNAERISVNPQTMSDETLRRIGRRHTAAETLEAYRLAREAGFGRVNIDLIAGLPGDTAKGFEETLMEVLKWAPENITVHTLSLKKGARLESDPEPYGQGVEQMLDFSRAKLLEHGYRPYYLYRQKFMAGGFENVGWSKPGLGSLYNVCMMEELHTCLSVGAGGVTKIVDGDRIERVFHCKYPLEYLAKHDKITDGIRAVEEFLKKSRGI